MNELRIFSVFPNALVLVVIAVVVALAVAVAVAVAVDAAVVQSDRRCCCLPLEVIILRPVGFRRLIGSSLLLLLLQYTLLKKCKQAKSR